MEPTLTVNSSYIFNSTSGKNCKGKYLGKDENSNILMLIEGDHPFNVNSEGLAIFYLSHYFFFRYFSPVLTPTQETTKQ